MGLGEPQWKAAFEQEEAFSRFSGSRKGGRLPRQNRKRRQTSTRAQQTRNTVRKIQEKKTQSNNSTNTDSKINKKDMEADHCNITAHYAAACLLVVCVEFVPTVDSLF